MSILTDNNIHVFINLNDSVNMQTKKNNFVVNTEYYDNTMENLQRTRSKKVKRFRSAFTTDQVNYLELQFKKFSYIGNAQRKEVAIALKIPERAVKIWFQNRRMKEKKESTGKEFDDEPNNRTSQEIAKDQFNNFGKPSANGQRLHSLPLLIDTNKTTSDYITISNNVSCNKKAGLLIADSGFKTFEAKKGDTPLTSSPYFVKPRNPSTLLNSNNTADFTTSLYNKYKYKSNCNPNITPLVKDQNIKQIIHQKPRKSKHIEQMIPEDLSSRKVNQPAAGQTQVSNVIPNNNGYIPLVSTVSPIYAQPYYSASGIIWNPVNVVSTAPASIPPVIQESVPKKCCTCDCHVKPLVPYNIQQQPSPQYVLTAVQFPSPSATKY